MDRNSTANPAWESGRDTSATAAMSDDVEGPGLMDLLPIWTSRWRWIIAIPVVVAATAFGATYLITPTFTARTTFLPPQHQQSAAAAAMASLGALTGLAGMGNVKSSADQYIALMQSNNVRDRIIDRFDLMKLYDARYRAQARAELDASTRIVLGKKDGIISLEADADSPKLAADLANQHVEELRRLSGELALTEAQQRRVLFEGELKRTREKLTLAQTALQGSGFNPDALKAEPKAAADNYARIKAEATTAEIRLQTMRRTMADSAIEIQQQLSLVTALQGQLRTLEASVSRGGDADYVGKYREFKYQETLFDLFAKQYEMARLDESRDGGLIQVIDVATPPERKSKPRRLVITLAVGALSLLAMLAWIYVRHSLAQGRKSGRPHAPLGQSGA